MKKFLSVFLSILVAFSAVGCNAISEDKDVSFDDSIKASATLDNPDSIFDNDDITYICEKLLPVFAICSNYSWDCSKDSKLLSAVGTNVFKYLVEYLYNADYGQTFENSNGRTDIENYIIYGAKYFDFDKADIQFAIENSSSYNSADNTVLMHDGLGCVLSTKLVAVAEGDEYTIDYIIMQPDEARMRYAKLIFDINSDGSFRFIRNIFTDTRYEPVYSPENRGYALSTPLTTSSDGKYTLYLANQILFNGMKLNEISLRDNIHQGSKSLGFIIDSPVWDAGFLVNGDIYTMDYSGLNVYSSEYAVREIKFTTKDNFKAGGFIGYDSKERYVFSIRRDPEKFDYIVIYGEYTEDADYSISHPNNFQLAYNYKIGLLDRDGNLTQSWDTGIPIMYSSYGFESVYMTRPSENEIEFFAMYKDEERFRARFDLSTGICTTLSAFELPDDEQLETVKQLADQWVPALSVLLGSDWNNNIEDLDFGFFIQLMALYRKDTNTDFPTIPAKQPNNYFATEAAKFSDLMPVAEKFFVFDNDELYDYFCSLPGYDAENDSAFLGDGWGWSLDCKVKDVVPAGEYYEVHYDLMAEDTVDCSKILTVSLHPDGHLVYISNRTV